MKVIVEGSKSNPESRINVGARNDGSISGPNLSRADAAGGKWYFLLP